MESTELRLLVLGCLCFRDRINIDAKESDRFELELAVPVNLLLFTGASIGSVVSILAFEGSMPVNVVRGTGNSDNSRVSTE